MASLTEALQAQCRVYMGSAGTFNEDLYGALAYLFQRDGAHLSELIAQAGGLQNLLYNGLWNPTVLPLAGQALARKNGAALWYAGAAADLSGFVYQDSAATLPATGTDPVGFLRDRAANLYPALQATAGNRPTLELQANGYYGMRFDGVNDLLSVSTLIATDVGNNTFIAAGVANNIALDSFFVSERTVSATTPVIGALGTVTTTGLARLVNRNDAGTAVTQFGPVNLLNTPVVLTGTASPTDNLQRFFANGVLLDSDPRATGATAVTNFSIGASVTTTSVYLNGLVYVVCAAPVALSDPDRTVIERLGALYSGVSYP